MQNSGALYFYTDRLIVRWDALDHRWPEVRAAIAATRRPVFAVLFEFERTEALGQKTPGAWKQLDALGPITFWRLESAP